MAMVRPPERSFNGENELSWRQNCWALKNHDGHHGDDDKDDGNDEKDDDDDGYDNKDDGHDCHDGKLLSFDKDAGDGGDDIEETN